jgi:hypothetical protein
VNQKLVNERLVYLLEVPFRHLLVLQYLNTFLVLLVAPLLSFLISQKDNMIVQDKSFWVNAGNIVEIVFDIGFEQNVYKLISRVLLLYFFVDQ